MRAILCAIELDNLINIVAGKGLLHDQHKAITQYIVDFLSIRTSREKSRKFEWSSETIAFQKIYVWNGIGQHICQFVQPAMC